MCPSDPIAEHYLQDALRKREAQNALRKLVVNSQLADFCSNDYLGFARSAAFAKAIEEEWKALGEIQNGSAGSRLLAGNTAYAETLEARIAAFHNAEAGLIYNSGYDANVGLFSAIGQKETTIIYDELVHASVHDGIRMSQAASYMFRHNDLFHLEERLKIAGGAVYVAVESIYSMDGDEALLNEIADLCNRYGAALIVDEAHATGVTVADGSGVVQKLKLEGAVFARVHTFGKGLGCHGAVVVGSKLLRDYLVNFSRAFIYTTALPMHSLVAINQSYTLLQQSADMIQTLQSNIRHFKQKAAENPGLQLLPSNSPIQCIVIPGNAEVKQVAAALQQDGFDIRPILNPTVQKNKERLRICIHAFNSVAEIDHLVECIGSHLQTING